MSTKTKLGRPKKFQGKKDQAHFGEQISQVLPPVIEFILRWEESKKYLLKQRGIDRRQEVLEFVANASGISPRTLERQYEKIGRLASSLIRSADQAGMRKVQLEIEYVGRNAPSAKMKRPRGRPRKQQK